MLQVDCVGENYNYEKTDDKKDFYELKGQQSIYKVNVLQTAR